MLKALEVFFGETIHVDTQNICLWVQKQQIGSHERKRGADGSQEDYTVKQHWQLLTSFEVLFHNSS